MTIIGLGFKGFELSVYIFLFPLALFCFEHMIFVYLLDVLAWFVIPWVCDLEKYTISTRFDVNGFIDNHYWCIWFLIMKCLCIWEIQYWLHHVLDQEGDFHKVDFDYFGSIHRHAQILLSTYFVWRWSLFVSQGESIQNIESLVKHNSNTLSKIHALKCMLLTCNIWKYPQSGYKSNHEWRKIKNKNLLIMMYNASTFKRKKQKKRKEKWYQIKGESSYVVYRSTRLCET